MVQENGSMENLNFAIGERPFFFRPMVQDGEPVITMIAVCDCAVR